MRVADSLSPNGRFDDIYLAVATLFEHQKDAFSKQERELAADILKRISKDVEMAIRIPVWPNRLAGDESAPHELILLLSRRQDRGCASVDPWRAVPILSDADLIRVIKKTDLRGPPDHDCRAAFAIPE